MQAKSLHEEQLEGKSGELKVPRNIYKINLKIFLAASARCRDLLQVCIINLGKQDEAQI